MKRLELDFCSTRRAAPWVGPLLLAVAAAVCLDTGLTYRDVHRSLGENEARLAKREPSSRAPKASAQEIALARETVQRLSMPWEQLFAALESAANDQVTLAAIEPDPRAGTVVISGDSKDYLAALTYVLNLSRTEGLDKVQLVRHEQKAADPKGPVSFAVSAAWSARP